MKRGILLVLLFAILLFNLVSASQLQVTSEHPFLLNGKWIEANQLKAGDLLTTIDGKIARITGIEKVTQNVQVYNLESDIFHDFVLSSGLIVHNSNSIDELSQADIIVLYNLMKSNPEIIHTSSGKYKNVFIINNDLLVSSGKLTSLPANIRKIIMISRAQSGSVAIKLAKPLKQADIPVSLENEALALKKISCAEEEMAQEAKEITGVSGEFKISPKLIYDGAEIGKEFLVEEGVGGETLVDIGTRYMPLSRSARARGLWDLAQKRMKDWMNDKANPVLKRAGVKYRDYITPGNTMIEFRYGGKSYTFGELVESGIPLDSVGMEIRFIDFDTVFAGDIVEPGEGGILGWNGMSASEQQTLIHAIFNDALNLGR